ncbi:MAG: entericidin A/B family lipoprotein [Legionella sp.]|nr:MAG: entericidin A/B family lipoprotein [Legionella sp.]
MKHVKQIAVACLFVSALSLLSACGTVRGFGHDVSATGNAISRAASR